MSHIIYIVCILLIDHSCLDRMTKERMRAGKREREKHIEVKAEQPHINQTCAIGLVLIMCEKRACLLFFYSYREEDDYCTKLSSEKTRHN